MDFRPATADDASEIVALLNATRHFPQLSAGDFVQSLTQYSDPQQRAIFFDRAHMAHLQYFFHPYAGYLAWVACPPEQVEGCLNFLDTLLAHKQVVAADKFPALGQALEKRGYLKVSEEVCQSLDLRHYQSVPVAQHECQFLTMDRLPPECWPSLYELELEVSSDSPNLVQHRQPDYSEFLATLMRHRQHHGFWVVAVKESQVLAVAQHQQKEHGYFYSSGTGVRRAVRGRGLAQAAKRVGLNLIHQAGGVRVETSNDIDNAVMLAINRKLGYQPLGRQANYGQSTP